MTSIGLAGPRAAEAHTDSCAGQGTMTTTVGFGTRGIPGSVRTGNAGLTFAIGSCASGKSVQMALTLTGWCLDFWGYGVTSSGHHFGITSTGGIVDLTGEVTGTGTVIPTGTDCTTQSARQFVVAALTFVKTHVTPVVRPQPLEAYCDTTIDEC